MFSIRELLLSLLQSGLLIAILVTLLSNQLALKRFRSDKWWEKKVEMYAKIIESLYHLINYTEQQMTDPRLKNANANKIDVELSSRSELASEEINRITSIGAFIISEDAVQRLITLRKDLEGATSMDSLYDYLEAEYGALDRCLRDVRELAKKDIDVK